MKNIFSLTSEHNILEKKGRREHEVISCYRGPFCQFHSFKSRRNSSERLRELITRNRNHGCPLDFISGELFSKKLSAAKTVLHFADQAPVVHMQICFDKAHHSNIVSVNIHVHPPTCSSVRTRRLLKPELRNFACSVYVVEWARTDWSVKLQRIYGHFKMEEVTSISHWSLSYFTKVRRTRKR